jgi:hypothetical protein
VSGVGVDTALGPVRAHVSATGPGAADALVAALLQGLGSSVATAVLYFASSHHDPGDLAAPIAAAFPEAAVIGCSTAGEFTDQVMTTGGLSAVALPYGILTGAVAALGDLAGGVAEGAWSAVQALEASLEVPLRRLDPTVHLGFALLDGLGQVEEAVTEVIGNAAPLLDVVGGSAGDDLAFRRTWVAVGEHVSYRGAALMVCQSGVPFSVVKAASFAPTGVRLRVTDADPATRAVRSFDGAPAAAAYAAALGLPPDQLDGRLWLQHPVGLMIDGRPWVRSPQAVMADGTMVFHAQLLPGTTVEILRPTDLVADTRAEVARARAALRGRGSGAVVFNSVLRRLEIDARQAGPAFLSSFGGLPLAGFNTYGETWQGHINQSLTGVVFG